MDAEKERKRIYRLCVHYGLIGPMPEGIEIKVAEPGAELRGAARLWTDEFAKCGYIPKADRPRIRVHDFPPTQHIIAKYGGAVVGNISLVIDSPLFGLPADKAFSAEIDEHIRANGYLACEGTNWVVAEAWRKTPVNMHLFAAFKRLAERKLCDCVVAEVNDRGHKVLYTLFNFDQIGDARNSGHNPDSDHDMVVLMMVCLPSVSPSLIDFPLLYPYFTGATA